MPTPLVSLGVKIALSAGVSVAKKSAIKIAKVATKKGATKSAKEKAIKKILVDEAKREAAELGKRKGRQAKKAVVDALSEKLFSSKSTIRKKFNSLITKRCFELIYKSYNLRSLGGKDKYGNSWKNTKRRKKNPKRRIMVDTGRLRESYRPGKVSGSSYTPRNSDQNATMVGDKIVIGSLVPYLKYSKRSVIPRRMMTKVINESVGYALTKLKKEMERSLERKARNKK
jgi:hypothetical protein